MTTCVRCGQELIAVYDGDTQFENALWLDLDAGGGYGMFTDVAFDAPSTKMVLCHECTHLLCDFLGIPLAQVATWHSHTADYRAAHPDHFGWDYTYKERNRNA